MSLHGRHLIPERVNRTSASACGRIHTQETGWQLGVRLCIMLGLLNHSVQELDAGTLDLIYSAMSI